MNLRTRPRIALHPADQSFAKEIAMGAETIWILAERLAGEHIAQFYSHETVLLESLRMFTTHGVSRGEAVVLLLTPSHRDLLLPLLTADGFDVGGLQHDGQLLLLDAAAVLASFMPDGVLDATLFRSSVGEVLERMKSRGYRTIRVFGEMVDLLWESDQLAAIGLEQLWTELIARPDSPDLAVFCGYSTSHVYESVPEALRTPHSHIITSATVEPSGDAIVGHTLDRRIVCWNRGAESIYGYAPDEAIGQPSSILMPPGSDELPGVIERVRRGQQVEHYETRRLRKDGTVIAVSVAVSPITSRDGEVVGVSVVGRDISDRRQAEEALLRLAAIVDSSNDAIIGKTLDTTIVCWNRGAERIYGYTAAEVIGRPISVLLPPGSEDEVAAIMERLRRGEKVEHFETKRQRKDRAVIDVSVTVSLIKTRGGEIIGASSTARDITERKQAEAAHSHIARLEESQAAHRLLLERVFETQEQERRRIARLLLERVFETQEQERRRIARELHDEAGQLMTSLLVGLRALDDSKTVDEAIAQAQRLRGIAGQAIEEIGRLARGLHSSVLDDHGLGVALQRYVADYSMTHNIATDVILNEPDIMDLPPAVQLALFRIVQEALTNVARHSGATAIGIRLARSPTTLETTIEDNGCGFEVNGASVRSEAHLGLQSMRERAAILGGTVSVTSGSTGTTIRVQLPVEEPDPKPL